MAYAYQLASWKEFELLSFFFQEMVSQMKVELRKVGGGS